VLFIGAVVDRHGRKVVLLSGLLAATVLLFAMSMTKNLYAIFIINAFHGVAAGAILVSSLALLADYAPADRRGREMGAFDAVNLLGWVTGYAMGALFLDILKGSLWEAFVIAAVMAFAGFVYSYINIKEKMGRKVLESRIRFKNIASVLKQRAVILLTLPWFIVFMMIGAVMTFLTGTVTGGQINISPRLVAAGILGAGIGLISTQVFYGRLSDKYGRMPIMLIGTIGFVGIMVTIGLGYFFAPYSPVPERMTQNIKDSIIRLWPAIGMFGFMALAFGPSALSSLADEAHENKRGVTMAVYSVVISAGMVVGIVAIGGISDTFGGPGVLLFMVGCAIAMLVLTVARYLDVRKRKRLEEDMRNAEQKEEDLVKMLSERPIEEIEIIMEK